MTNRRSRIGKKRISLSICLRLGDNELPYLLFRWGKNFIVGTRANLSLAFLNYDEEIYEWLFETAKTMLSMLRSNARKVLILAKYMFANRLTILGDYYEFYYSTTANGPLPCKQNEWRQLIERKYSWLWMRKIIWNKTIISMKYICVYLTIWIRFPELYIQIQLYIWTAQSWIDELFCLHILLVYTECNEY